VAVFVSRPVVRNANFIVERYLGQIVGTYRGTRSTRLKDANQEPLAAWAAYWLAICSFILCCISLGVGCAVWVATIQM
jgi:hypothetical protein